MARDDQLSNLIDRLPERLQAPATRWMERIAAAGVLPEGDALSTLVRVVACSDFAAGVLLREAGDHGLDPQVLDAPWDASLPEALRERTGGDVPVDDVKAVLRRERDRQLLRIVWRDVSDAAGVEETLRDLSAVADALIGVAAAYAASRIALRHGIVRDAAGEPVPMLVIGMGKLGGRELNFSSDVDLIFAYPSGGESDGDRPLSAQPYFDRLSRTLVDLLDVVTEDGFVYRTDTRLRPFGDSGPPVVSFGALESYLTQHGRDWERYAWVKARLVAPADVPAIERELLDQIVRPFVYRGYLDFGVFESLRDMHARITSEGRQREMRDNLKLGPGGIREIEFIVQSLQLVRGGDVPSLRTPHLLPALSRLAETRGLDRATADALRDAYLFLRRAENAVQAMRDRQTHDLPDDDADRDRLCLATGFADWPAFIAALDTARAAVTAHFGAIALRDDSDADAADAETRFADLWARDADAAEWEDALDPGVGAGIAAQVVAFRRSPAARKLGNTAAERLQQFVPRLIDMAGECDDPERAVQRCLDVVASVLRRSAYLALLNENRAAMRRFVTLCARSAHISAELARFPVLLDELLETAVNPARLARAELGRELDTRLAQRPDADVEEQMEQLAQFQRAAMFRIAVGDLRGDLQIMQVSDSLTYLAEVVLERALAIAWSELTARHGAPHFVESGERKAAGFGVIAYGKLGGLELSYGSDLDVVFLHDSRGDLQETDGEKPLDNTMFYSRLVRRLVHFMSTRTTTGALYEIDTRLRPSGRKGLLVTSTEAFRRYQDENAWTWEHQALLRARPVSGSPAVGEAFERIRLETLTRGVRREQLRDDVFAMRARMRKELDDSDGDGFNLKHGSGAVGDIEFLVQFLVLANAEAHPAVIEYTDNVRQLNALAECGALPLSTAAKLQEIYRRYRERQHRLALNDGGGRVPDTEFRTERAYVEECWQQVFGP